LKGLIMLKDLLTSLRLALATFIACSIVYPGTLLLLGLGLAPAKAAGSLVYAPDGEIVGSRLVAQGFTRPEYLWPRPSAVDYAGNAAGGTNLSPSNPVLIERAAECADRLGASFAHPVPADLVSASGSGLDPHVTLEGALYQAERIAEARATEPSRVEALIRRHATTATPWVPALVDMLELDLALDDEFGSLR